MARSINEVAIAALARREHSALEMRRKLMQKGFAEDEVEASLKQLVDNNLLSDERFTESYINMRRQRGYGPLRISNELRERGVADELVSNYLDRNDPIWRQTMRAQYIKKYGRDGTADYAEKARRAKYLQTRGFPLDWIFKLDSMDELDY